MVFTARVSEYLTLSEALKMQWGFTGHITAGGYFVSFYAEQILSTSKILDTVIHGEGENTLVELAANLDKPQFVKNVSYRNEFGIASELLIDQNDPALDTLSWPTRTPPFRKPLQLVADR